MFTPDWKFTFLHPIENVSVVVGVESFLVAEKQSVDVKLQSVVGG
jgi:hypothetical protein